MCRYLKHSWSHRYWIQSSHQDLKQPNWQADYQPAWIPIDMRKRQERKIRISFKVRFFFVGIPRFNWRTQQKINKNKSKNKYRSPALSSGHAQQLHAGMGTDVERRELGRMGQIPCYQTSVFVESFYLFSVSQFHFPR